MYQNLRTVKVTKKPVYQSDSGTEEFLFSLDKMVGTLDLSTLTPFLKIRFQDESTDKILITQKAVDGDKLVCKFTPSEALTRVAGEAKCQLCFENQNGSITVNSQIFVIDILDSIEVESFGQTILPSAIRLLQTELNGKIENLNQKLIDVNNLITIQTAILAKQNFINGSQTVALDKADSSSVVVFSPLNNYQDFKTASLFISDQGSGYVTLTALGNVNSDLTIKFAVINQLELNVDL